MKTRVQTIKRNENVSLDLIQGSFDVGVKSTKGRSYKSVCVTPSKEYAMRVYNRLSRLICK